LRSDATLFVADWVNTRVQAFASGSAIGTTVISSTSNPQGVFIDSVSNLYVTLGTSHKVMIYPAGISVPSTTSASCTWSISLNDAYGVAVDRSDNIYVSSASCSFISRWNVNGTSATMLLASSSLVNQPRHIYLDENNAVLYVADTLNHRILKIFLNGNSTAQTVAGIFGVSGNTANKLNRPAGVYVSRIDGSIYVADTSNNRIQKWLAGASTGITVAGNSNGASGSSMYALNGPYAVILDPAETFLYVADYNNNRVQRFLLS
jgi:DNA-binding beta-propeller fold protein YncE